MSADESLLTRTPPHETVPRPAHVPYLRVLVVVAMLAAVLAVAAAASLWALRADRSDRREACLVELEAAVIVHFGLALDAEPGSADREAAVERIIDAARRLERRGPEC